MERCGKLELRLLRPKSERLPEDSQLSLGVLSMALDERASRCGRRGDLSTTTWPTDRGLRTLSIVDAFTRDCLAIEAC
jgi:hypothetical protein